MGGLGPISMFFEYDLGLNPTRFCYCMTQYLYKVPVLHSLIQVYNTEGKNIFCYGPATQSFTFCNLYKLHLYKNRKEVIQHQSLRVPNKRWSIMHQKNLLYSNGCNQIQVRKVWTTILNYNVYNNISNIIIQYTSLMNTILTSDRYCTSV